MHRRFVWAGLLLATSAIAVDGPAHAGETVTYSYDVLGRLVRVQRSGGPANGVDTGYAYDCADNRRQVSTGAGARSAPPAPPCPAPPPAVSGR